MAIDSLIIPRPSEFHLGTANFPETNILVQTVRYGDIELTNHALKIFYTEDLCTRINFDNVFDSSLLGVQDKEIEVLDTSMTEDVKLFPVKKKIQIKRREYFPRLSKGHPHKS